MCNKLIKFNIVFIACIIILDSIITYAVSSKVTFDDRYKTLKILKVFEDDNKLDEYMTRNDFAKYLVNISPEKDTSSNDIDTVTKKGYMFRSITGDFKGNEFVRYNDVSRACLALLGYTNSDFTGNQVAGRNKKFVELYLNENIDRKVNDYFTKRDVANALYNTLRTEMHTSTTKTSNTSTAETTSASSTQTSGNNNASTTVSSSVNSSGSTNTTETTVKEEKTYNTITELVESSNSTKSSNNSTSKTSSTNKINILSNTSNKNFYGKKVFNKLELRLDNELNASAYVEKELIGPYILKPGSEFTSKFQITDNNVYINGLKSKKEDLEYDIGAFGFALVYYDNTNSTLYAYTYRDDIEANVYLRKDYINEVYYNATDMTKPYKVMIGNNKYFIDSEDMKVMFSPSGKYREGDQILFIASKYLDKDSMVPVDITYDEVNKRYHFYIDTSGTEVYYSSTDKKWYYDVIVGDGDNGFTTEKKEYTGSYFVKGHDEEHISGGIIYAMKY